MTNCSLISSLQEFFLEKLGPYLGALATSIHAQEAYAFTAVHNDKYPWLNELQAHKWLLCLLIYPFPLYTTVKNSPTLKKMKRTYGFFHHHLRLRHT